MEAAVPVPAGAGLATAGGDLPMGRRVVDLRATAGGGGGHADDGFEAFELPRSTRELIAAATAPTELVEAPPEGGGPPEPSAERSSWPEIRFYIGSAALFFVTFILATAFWVVLPTVVLGWQPTAITSGSMEPAIRSGDVVVGDPDVPADLGPGTVVTFRATTGALITHRVIATDGDGRLVTRGDANSDPDRPSPAVEDVLSVGRILVPFAGYPSVWAQSGAWWAVVAMGLGAAWLAWASRWALFERYDPWAEEVAS